MIWPGVVRTATGVLGGGGAVSAAESPLLLKSRVVRGASMFTTNSSHLASFSFLCVIRFLRAQEVGQRPQFIQLHKGQFRLGRGQAHYLFVLRVEFLSGRNHGSAGCGNNFER